MNKKLLYTIAFYTTICLWLVSIYLLFAKTPFTAGMRVPRLGAHTLMFFALGFMTVCTQYRPKPLLTLFLIWLFGGVSEIIQYFDPPRTCDIVDFFEDIVGASLGVGVALLTLMLLRQFMLSSLWRSWFRRKEASQL